MALDAFLIISPGANTLPGGSRLVGAPSPDPLEPSGIAVEVSAFAFGVENPATIGAATGGAGAGKARNIPFTVTKTVDSLSPSPLMLAGQGAHFSRMEVYLRHPAPAAGHAPGGACGHLAGA